MNENLKNFIVNMENFNTDNVPDFLSEVAKYFTGVWVGDRPFTNDPYSIGLIRLSIIDYYKPRTRNFGKDEKYFYVSYDMLDNDYKDYLVFTPDEFLKIISRKPDSRMKVIK